MGEAGLNDEQKKFLEECENEFKDRYTESDAEFMKIKNMKRKDPPIVDPWYGGNKRFNNDRGGRYKYFKERYRHSDERYPGERNRQSGDRYRQSNERYRPSDERHIHPQHRQHYRP